jgi:hypothetical protein
MVNVVPPINNREPDTWARATLESSRMLTTHVPAWVRPDAVISYPVVVALNFARGNETTLLPLPWKVAFERTLRLLFVIGWLHWSARKAVKIADVPAGIVWGKPTTEHCGGYTGPGPIVTVIPAFDWFVSMYP